MSGGAVRRSGPARRRLVGIAAGAVLLARLSERSGCSILAVAVWHGTYNLAVASDAGDGAIAAVITVVVIAVALVLTRCGDFRPDRSLPPARHHDDVARPQ